MITFAKLGEYGRLGNMLWQCAATIGHARRFNHDYAFPRWQYEDDFNIPKSKFKDGIKYSNEYKEPHFHYADIPDMPNMNLHGYFQSSFYWEENSKEIRKLLMPKCIGYNPPDTGFTSVHVRRGDYLIHKGCYNILDMNYYEKAMEIAGTEKFLIFSDDIPWCKQHFIGNKFEFSERQKPHQDLARMIKCSNHIVANSSFSWWGAFLGTDQAKVIAPKLWFGPTLAPTHNAKDLLLSNWIKI